MKFSTGGIVYAGGVEKFDTDTTIDCGSGYTGDELADNAVVTQKPYYVQDLLLPNYYYTDTKVLAEMGYYKYLTYIVGNGSKFPEKTMPVLISVPNNYTLVDEQTYLKFIRSLFVLSYYNTLSATDKNSSSINTLIFGIMVKNSPYTLPFLPSQLSCLKFHDKDGNVVPFNNTTIQDPTVVERAVYKSPTTNKEYPLNFYSRSDSVICDMYIGGYHIQLVTYSSFNNNLDTDISTIYVSACNDIDFCNKFWFSVNSLPMRQLPASLPADAQPFKSSQYDYAFGKDNKDNTIAWNISSKDRVIGKDIADTYIRYYKAFNNSDLYIGNGLALDFDPNIFNTVGINYPSNYSTIGVLPSGFDLNKVGVDGFARGYTTPLKYAYDDSTSQLYLPLGVYMLDPNGTYSTGGGNSLGGAFSSLRAYSPNGNTLVQEITNNTINSSYPTYFRINNSYNNSSNFDSNWSSWEYRAWD